MHHEKHSSNMPSLGGHGGDRHPSFIKHHPYYPTSSSIIFMPSVSNGYYAVRNDGWTNLSVIEDDRKSDDSIEDEEDKLNLITTVYVGGITVVGLFILYRLLKK